MSKIDSAPGAFYTFSMTTQHKEEWNNLVGWNEGYNIGNRHIDAEHRKLVGLLVNLKDYVVEGGFSADTDTFAVIVKSLVDYTKVHFTSEQALMAQHAYPALPDHVRLHSVFVKAVDDFSNTVASGEPADLHKLYDFLFNWLIGHILQEDRKFAKYLQDKGIG